MTRFTETWHKLSLYGVFRLYCEQDIGMCRDFVASLSRFNRIDSQTVAEFWGTETLLDSKIDFYENKIRISSSPLCGIPNTFTIITRTFFSNKRIF